MNDPVLLLIAGIPVLTGWILALVEVARRGDLSLARRASWILILVLVPIIGLAAYLVLRPPKLETAPPATERSLRRAEKLVEAAEDHQRGEIDDSGYRQRIQSLELAAKVER